MGVLDKFLDVIKLSDDEYDDDDFFEDDDFDDDYEEEKPKKDSSREKSRLMIWMKRKKNMSRREVDVQITTRLHRCVSRQEGVPQQWKYV